MKSDQILLFLHIPKTGGSTLGKFLYGHESFAATIGDHELSGTRFYNYGIFHYPTGFYKDPPGFVSESDRMLPHLSGLRAVIGHFSYGLHKRISGSAYYATIVRHPVDRVVSLYAHQRITALKKDVTLFTFASRCPEDGWAVQLRDWYPHAVRPAERALRQATRSIVDNDQVRRISGDDPHFGSCTRSTLEKAKQNLRNHFGVIGTTDRFDEVLLILNVVLGSERLPRYLPHLINRDRPPRSQISDDERSAIESRNELDLELYQYAHDMLGERVDRLGPEFQSLLSRFRQENQKHIARYAEVLPKLELG